jgi:hypothetical protein
MVEDGAVPFPAEQPQWVARSKVNFRGRKRAHSSKAAVTPTIASDTNCCQSIMATYAENAAAQLGFAGHRSVEPLKREAFPAQSAIHMEPAHSRFITSTL